MVGQRGPYEPFPDCSVTWQNKEWFIWHLMSQALFKHKLVTIFGETYLTKQECIANYATKIDYFLTQIQKSYWRREMFAIVHTAAMEYVQNGCLVTTNHRPTDPHTAMTIKKSVREGVESLGHDKEYFPLPSNSYEAAFNHTRTSYLDAVRHMKARFAYQIPAVSYHLEQLWIVYAGHGKRARLSWGLYASLSGKLCSHFIPGLSGEGATGIARTMWPYDCGLEDPVEIEKFSNQPDQLTMTFSCFEDWILDIMGSWCMSSNPNEHIALMRHLAENVLKVGIPPNPKRCKMGRRAEMDEEEEFKQNALLEEAEAWRLQQVDELDSGESAAVSVTVAVMASLSIVTASMAAAKSVIIMEKIAMRKKQLKEMMLESGKDPMSSPWYRLDLSSLLRKDQEETVQHRWPNGAEEMLMKMMFPQRVLHPELAEVLAKPCDEDGEPLDIQELTRTRATQDSGRISVSTASTSEKSLKSQSNRETTTPADRLEAALEEERKEARKASRKQSRRKSLSTGTSPIVRKKSLRRGSSARTTKWKRRGSTTEVMPMQQDYLDTELRDSEPAEGSSSTESKADSQEDSSLRTEEDPYGPSGEDPCLEDETLARVLAWRDGVVDPFKSAKDRTLSRWPSPSALAGTLGTVTSLSKANLANDSEENSSGTASPTASPLLFRRMAEMVRYKNQMHKSMDNFDMAPDEEDSSPKKKLVWANKGRFIQTVDVAIDVKKKKKKKKKGALFDDLAPEVEIVEWWAPYSVQKNGKILMQNEFSFPNLFRKGEGAPKRQLTRRHALGACINDYLSVYRAKEQEDRMIEGIRLEKAAVWRKGGDEEGGKGPSRSRRFLNIVELTQRMHKSEIDGSQIPDEERKTPRTPVDISKTRTAFRESEAVKHSPPLWRTARDHLQALKLQEQGRRKSGSGLTPRKMSRSPQRTNSNQIVSGGQEDGHVDSATVYKVGGEGEAPGFFIKPFEHGEMVLASETLEEVLQFRPATVPKPKVDVEPAEIRPSPDYLFGTYKLGNQQDYLSVLDLRSRAGSFMGTDYTDLASGVANRSDISLETISDPDEPKPQEPMTPETPEPPTTGEPIHGSFARKSGISKTSARKSRWALLSQVKPKLFGSLLSEPKSDTKPTERTQDTSQPSLHGSSPRSKGSEGKESKPKQTGTKLSGNELTIVTGSSDPKAIDGAVEGDESFEEEFVAALISFRDFATQTTPRNERRIAKQERKEEEARQAELQKRAHRAKKAMKSMMKYGFTFSGLMQLIQKSKGLNNVHGDDITSWEKANHMNAALGHASKTLQENLLHGFAVLGKDHEKTVSYPPIVKHSFDMNWNEVDGSIAKSGSPDPDNSGVGWSPQKRETEGLKKTLPRPFKLTEGDGCRNQESLETVEKVILNHSKRTMAAKPIDVETPLGTSLETLLTLLNAIGTFAGREHPLNSDECRRSYRDTDDASKGSKPSYRTSKPVSRRPSKGSMARAGSFWYQPLVLDFRKNLTESEDIVTVPQIEIGDSDDENSDGSGSGKHRLKRNSGFSEKLRQDIAQGGKAKEMECMVNSFTINKFQSVLDAKYSTTGSRKTSRTSHASALSSEVSSMHSSFIQVARANVSPSLQSQCSSIRSSFRRELSLISTSPAESKPVRQKKVQESGESPLSPISAGPEDYPDFSLATPAPRTPTKRSQTSASKKTSASRKALARKKKNQSLNDPTMELSMGPDITIQIDEPTDEAIDEDKAKGGPDEDPQGPDRETDQDTTNEDLAMDTTNEGPHDRRDSDVSIQLAAEIVVESPEPEPTTSQDGNIQILVPRGRPGNGQEGGPIISLQSDPDPTQTPPQSVSSNLSGTPQSLRPADLNFLFHSYTPAPKISMLAQSLKNFTAPTLKYIPKIDPKSPKNKEANDTFEEGQAEGGRSESKVSKVSGGAKGKGQGKSRERGVSKARKK